MILIITSMYVIVAEGGRGSIAPFSDLGRILEFKLIDFDDDKFFILDPSLGFYEYFPRSS